MAEFSKSSYVYGAALAKATDPTGDNVGANFVRGFALYHDAELRKERNVKIEATKAEFKAWLRKQS